MPEHSAPPTTLGMAVERVAGELRAAALSEPLAEARRLVAAAAGCSALDLVTRREQPVSDAAMQEIMAWTARRLDHEPLSRIVGEREFFGRPFWLSKGTLDPRPDTEALVEAALDAATARGGRDTPLRLLDLGTGSGAIAVTLLAELPRATALAVDLSADALATAARNAARHGVEGRLELARIDMADVAALGRQAPFDLIVSNPPYIASAELATLEPEVRLYDPALALDGGADGLVAYRALADLLGLLAPGAAMLLEVGAGQAAEVVDLFLGRAPSLSAETRRDLGGHERVVALWQRG